MKEIKKLRLRKDIIIPAGTVLECIDGCTRRYVSGNYETLVALGPDMTASVVVGDDALARLREEYLEMYQ